VRFIFCGEKTTLGIFISVFPEILGSASPIKSIVVGRFVYNSTHPVIIIRTSTSPSRRRHDAHLTVGCIPPDNNNDNNNSSNSEKKIIIYGIFISSRREFRLFGIIFIRVYASGQSNVLYGRKTKTTDPPDDIPINGLPIYC